MKFSTSVWDIETDSADIRKVSTVHFLSVLDKESGEIALYSDLNIHSAKVGDLEEGLDLIRSGTIKTHIGHNLLGYDLVVLEKLHGITFRVSQEVDEPDYVNGHACAIYDTLVISKMLDPDRLGGHSLENLSRKLVAKKIPYEKRLEIYLEEQGHLKESIDDWLAHIWERPTELMGDYNIDDCRANSAVFDFLMEEAINFDEYRLCYWIEKGCFELVNHRSQYVGFKVDIEYTKELYQKLLDEKERLENIVLPRLPRVPLGKTEMKKHTPSKTQVTSKGKMHATFKKWLIKEGAEILGEDSFFFEDKVYKLPIPCEPLKDYSRPATSRDYQAHKEFLLSLGWEPDEQDWKMRDLSKKTGSFLKLSEPSYRDACLRYATSTIEGPFAQGRLKLLKVNNPANLYEHLVKQKRNQSIKVPTTPSITNDKSKELNQSVVRLAEQHEWVKDLVNLYTVQSRLTVLNNSSSGGWLFNERVLEEGYIDTPADTCGAFTHRFKHKLVVNVPNESSMYGLEMRSCLGAGPGEVLVGCDGSQLEARLQANAVLPWDAGGVYGKTLLNDKVTKKTYREDMTPADADVHQGTACKMLGYTLYQVVFEVPEARQVAKSCFYGAMYGAGAEKVAQLTGRPVSEGKALHEAFWNGVAPLRDFRDYLKEYAKAHGYITLADGSKATPRSMHANVNTYIQNCGAQACKIVAMYCDRKIREEESGARIAIIYHDEVQVRQPKEEVKSRKFETEEEAIKFAKQRESEGERWAVQEVKENYYAMYSKVGQWLSEGWEYASNILGLSIPLKGDYKIGKTWADTH